MNCAHGNQRRGESRVDLFREGSHCFEGLISSHGCQKHYLLIGGAEDEEGAGLWDGHCFLFQLQLSQRAWSGAHWDLRLIFLVVPWGREKEIRGFPKLCRPLASVLRVLLRSC